MDGDDWEIYLGIAMLVGGICAAVGGHITPQLPIYAVYTGLAAGGAYLLFIAVTQRDAWDALALPIYMCLTPFSVGHTVAYGLKNVPWPSVTIAW